MISKVSSPRLAVLIDAENLAASHAATLFADMEKHGFSAIRRAYGDFSEGRLKAWADCVPVHAIEVR